MAPSLDATSARQTWAKACCAKLITGPFIFDLETALDRGLAACVAARMSNNAIAFGRKAASILSGLASRNRRIESAQRLLAYTLHSLPTDAMKCRLEYAPRLPDDALSMARLYADREAMLTALPKGGTVAEAGVYRGKFSRAIVQTCKPDKFHLIDIDLRPLGPVSGPIETHEGDSSTILTGFPEAHFDWIYIDGDHSYPGVSRDLQAAHRVLKPGGYLMCNDYSNWCSAAAIPYGVARAVNELIIAEGYAVRGLALHPAGLHDILVQRPAESK